MTLTIVWMILLVISYFGLRSPKYGDRDNLYARVNQIPTILSGWGVSFDKGIDLRHLSPGCDIGHDLLDLDPFSKLSIIWY